jgi:hypothetical protein
MTRFGIAAFFTLSATATALAGSPSLSQLPPGDRLHVSYHSRGCFHDRKYEIDFERAASVTARSSGRAVSLSPKEIASFAAVRKSPVSITSMVRARLMR